MMLTLVFNPYFWIALAATFMLGWGTGCTHEHAEVTRVEKAWETDKQMRLAAAEAEAKARADIATAAQAKQALAEKRIDDAYTDLKARNKDVDAKLAKLTVDRGIVDRLRDTIRSTNASASDAATPAAKDSPTAAGPAAITTGQTLAGWFDTVANLYGQCREEVIGWNKFWDEQVAIP